MVKNVLSGQDAIGRVHLQQIRYQEQAQKNPQVLAAGVAISNSIGVQTSDMGQFGTATLLLHASEAATFAVWHSHDGVQWFHDTAFDVVFAAPGDQVQGIQAAPFVKVIPTVNQTAGWVVVMACFS